LDQRQEPDPEERGLYWATGFLDTPKIFGFRPDDVVSNVDADRMGNPVTKEQLCGSQGCPAVNKPENIIGNKCLSFGLFSY